jgi:hypothetical protein
MSPYSGQKTEIAVLQNFGTCAEDRSLNTVVRKHFANDYFEDRERDGKVKEKGKAILVTIRGGP